jgi:ketosteroid isomerase-like protein
VLRPVFCLMLSAASLGAQTPADTLRRLDSLWAASYASHDTALARRLFSPDLIITATNGSQKGVTEELRDVAPYPGTTVHYFRSSGQQWQHLGDASAVAGLLAWELETNGQRSAVRRRYTAIWERGGPLGWRMVMLHIGQAPRLSQ